MEGNDTMTFKLVFTILTSFICAAVISFGCFYNQDLFAQEPGKDVVYFTDGSIAMGTIDHISRKKIRVKLPDGTIIERPITFLYRFSSKRHFREIYERSVEYEDNKFMNRHGDW